MDWDHIRFVLAIGRGGTLSAAAQALGVDQTTVSRRLAAVEQAVGGPLFQRVGGRLQPTPAGAEAMVRAERMEVEATAFAVSARDTHAEPAGPVRLTSVDSLMTCFLAPRIWRLRARYPRLVPELIAAGANLDLGRREADVALRLARPREGAMKVRKVADLGYAVYVARGIDPATAGWMAYDESMAALPEAQWLLTQEGGTAPVLRATSVAALAAAAVAGAGRAVLPCLVGDAYPALLRAGPPVLRRELWLAVHEDLSRLPAIRAVADWLADTIAVERAVLETGHQHCTAGPPPGD